MEGRSCVDQAFRGGVGERVAIVMRGGFLGIGVAVDVNGDQIAMGRLQPAHLRQGDGAVAAEGDRHRAGPGDGRDRTFHHGKTLLDIAGHHRHVAGIARIQELERVDIRPFIAPFQIERRLADGAGPEPRSDPRRMRAAIERQAEDDSA